MTLAPSWVRRRIASRLVASSGPKRSGLSAISVLPKHLTMPLRRDGVDPVAALTFAREQQPVMRLGRVLGMTVWLVSGYEQARAVLNDGSRFSNDIRPLLGTAVRSSIDGLGFTDAPEHTRLRKILTPEFTGRRIARLAPHIERIVDERLDVLDARHGVVDLVADFAFPIPFLVICDLLGLPVDDHQYFRDLGRTRFDVNGGGSATFAAMSDTRDFLTDAVRQQRTRPGDGLIGSIIRTHGDHISDIELAGLADGVFTGGYETSASMLALGILALIQDTESMKSVASSDEGLDRIIDELLRHLSVVQISFPRFARQDMRLYGQPVKRGDTVLCSLAAANRDEIFGADAENMDSSRTPIPHLAFGSGIHRCIGAELARLELRAALRGFASRFPDTELAIDPAALEFRELSIVFGLQSLPVRLRPAPRASDASFIQRGSS